MKQRELTFLITAFILGAVIGGLVGDIIGSFLPDGAAKTVFTATGYFNRNASIPEIGYENQISSAAFMLTKENPLPEKTFNGTKGTYVIRLKNRKLPEAEGFDKEQEQIKETLLVRKQSKTFNEWLQQIKEGSEITIKEGIIENS